MSRGAVASLYNTLSVNTASFNPQAMNVSFSRGTDTLHFFYDAQSRPALVEYNGTVYAYVHSLIRKKRLPCNQWLSTSEREE